MNIHSAMSRQDIVQELTRRMVAINWQHDLVGNLSKNNGSLNGSFMAKPIWSAFSAEYKEAFPNAIAGEKFEIWAMAEALCREELAHRARMAEGASVAAMLENET